MLEGAQLKTSLFDKMWAWDKSLLLENLSLLLTGLVPSQSPCFGLFLFYFIFVSKDAAELSLWVRFSGCPKNLE